MQQSDPGKGEGLLLGDVERVRLEWISLLRHTARAPDFEWDRWRELQAEAEKLLLSHDSGESLVAIPPLSSVQNQKFEHRLRLTK